VWIFRYFAMQKFGRWGTSDLLWGKIKRFGTPDVKARLVEMLRLNRISAPGTPWTTRVGPRSLMAHA
jgi:hypothetical protein